MPDDAPHTDEPTDVIRSAVVGLIDAGIPVMVLVEAVRDPAAGGVGFAAVGGNDGDVHPAIDNRGSRPQPPCANADSPTGRFRRKRSGAGGVACLQHARQSETDARRVTLEETSTEADRDVSRRYSRQQ